MAKDYQAPTLTVIPMQLGVFGDYGNGGGGNDDDDHNGGHHGHGHGHHWGW
ncbi:MAG: hypothetical protein R3D98_13350 [Candidatus Krumholzibacteriia bacterium]